MPHATATRAGIQPGSQRRDRGPGGFRARTDGSPVRSDALLEDSSDRGVPQLVLGLRFLALAVVAGSGALLPIATAPLSRLTACILAGAGIGIAQYAARSRLRSPHPTPPLAPRT